MSMHWELMVCKWYYFLLCSATADTHTAGQVYSSAVGGGGGTLVL